MSKVLFAVLVCLSIFFCCSDACTVSPGKTKFKEFKFVGSWYVVGSNWIAADCLKFVFYSNKNNSITYTETFHFGDMNGNYDCRLEYADSKSTAQFDDYCPDILVTTPESFSILDTDYYTYAVITSCIEGFDILNILARDPGAYDAVLADAEAAVTNAGLTWDPTTIIPYDNTMCSEPPSKLKIKTFNLISLLKG